MSTEDDDTSKFLKNEMEEPEKNAFITLLNTSKSAYKGVMNILKIAFKPLTKEDKDENEE